MSIYDNFAVTAKKLLAKYGAAAVVTNTTGGVSNPATGAIEGATTTVLNGNGFATSYKNTDVDGSSILKSDVKVIIEKTASAPVKGSTCAINGKVYRVMEVMPISPAGTDVIYIMQCRV